MHAFVSAERLIINFKLRRKGKAPVRVPEEDPPLGPSIGTEQLQAEAMKLALHMSGLRIYSVAPRMGPADNNFL
jgi:hypothetical protein